ncbi:Xaa-Pro peptidase family protein [Salipiger sp. P9]|uniref:M24 family metallopeptidase n=1 Tax=Salipiger pentaromativorans TaxID=2943193 RepID=UPI0021573399|nr:Xaa-Pro peptidase family protein [Salipiger pentaromativorans]MCR8546470.1 Xaa-Pro peptidase family protein [Salipiger pentaromativorans]
MRFPESEFRARLSAAQAQMARAGRDALLLTTEPEIRYFTGFLTRFWESPTRPWFLVVPVRGDPVAVIPAIGQPLMAQGWLSDIRCWSSPDYRDDGVSLLADTLAALVPPGGAIGLPSGGETHLRMPLASWEALRAALPDRQFGDDADILRRLRMVKSPAEIACISRACAIAGRAFARVPEIARAGVPLSGVFRRFQMLCLEEGADWVPYLAGAAAQGGYADVISPATEAPLTEGDVLMLDTGLVRDGYFCDFDRNVSIGPAAPALREAHAALIAATQAGFAAARPGARVCDLYDAMAAVTGGGAESGRLGHGLGMQLTEPPSLIPADETVLVAGMVLTLEPLIDMGQGRILVHEENIVIEETGARWLSPAAPPEIVEILP